MKVNSLADKLHKLSEVNTLIYEGTWRVWGGFLNETMRRHWPCYHELTRTLVEGPCEISQKMFDNTQIY